MKIGIVLAIITALVGVCIFLAFTPRNAYAHGSGLTLSATTTSYYIDVDYSDYVVYAGESGRFDLKLYTDPARTKSVDFERVWVRIVQKNELPEGDTIFSGWIAKASFGPTGFSIALPSAGQYSINVRYVRGDTTIENGTLPFRVEARKSSYWSPYSIVGAVGALLAALAGVAFISFQLTRRRS